MACYFILRKFTAWSRIVCFNCFFP